jgi:hypothetical protein
MCLLMFVDVYIDVVANAHVCEYQNTSSEHFEIFYLRYEGYEGYEG